ncbi:REP-associated tyrosine transposase [Hymenobacter arizonensis]|uniref:REP element-mobilizing transposase RayT n=1 Tax=Hymenobacter arizonensis TaxID=1227077 RepID=A0A1I5XV06_HYMAR|nr:transposase [Hymenobacter arizonensis]SFQ35706.1 REP element-mobilizing transposase RayT [Hymenobacter arizonensis]
MSERYKTYEGGLFFVTLTVVGWIDVFTRSDYAEVFLESLRFCIRRKGLRVYAFCIMPSHVHLIADVDDGLLLAHVLRDLKSFTAKRIYELIETHPQESRREWLLYLLKFYGRPHGQAFKFWQEGNHPLDLKSAAWMRQKQDYIHQNPVQSRLADEAHHYPFSSAFPDCGVPLSEFL